MYWGHSGGSVCYVAELKLHRHRLAYFKKLACPKLLAKQRRMNVEHERLLPICRDGRGFDASAHARLDGSQVALQYRLAKQESPLPAKGVATWPA